MIIIGASGHAHVVLDILLRNHIVVDYLLDAKPPCNELLGIPVRKDDVNVKAKADECAIIAIGNNRIRKEIAESRPYTYGLALHEDATVSRYAKVGAGSAVMAKAAINASAVIGNHCIINTGAVIEHECVLGDYVHVSPNAAVGGNVKIGEGSHIGIGASIIQGITIGKWVTVGAGAVIIRDVPDGATVVGNPGRILR